MVGKWELVEQGGAFNGMGLTERVEIGAQGLRVAGNIEDVVESGNQFERLIINTGAWRIDKNS